MPFRADLWNVKNLNFLVLCVSDEEDFGCPCGDDPPPSPSVPDPSQNTVDDTGHNLNIDVCGLVTILAVFAFFLHLASVASCLDNHVMPLK